MPCKCAQYNYSDRSLLFFGWIGVSLHSSPERCSLVWAETLVGSPQSIGGYIIMNINEGGWVQLHPIYKPQLYMLHMIENQRVHVSSELSTHEIYPSQRTKYTTKYQKKRKKKRIHKEALHGTTDTLPFQFPLSLICYIFNSHYLWSAISALQFFLPDLYINRCITTQ